MKKISILLFIFLITIALIVVFRYKTDSEYKPPSSVLSVNPGNAEAVNNPTESAEQRIYELFKKAAANDASDEAKNEFFNSFKYINWKILNEIHENASYDLLDWLYTSEISSEINITNLLKATKGLDGAMSEGYSGITAKLFLQDKHKFITCLSRVPVDSVDNICSYVAYGCSYFDLKQIVDDTEKLINTEEMSNQEIIVAKKLKDAINEELNFLK